MVVEVASRLKELVGVADGNVRKVEVLGDHVDDVWEDEARSVSPLAAGKSGTGNGKESYPFGSRRHRCSTKTS
jgi:hypothetical protein